MSAPRPVCVHCGKPYGQRNVHTVTLRWADGEPEPDYGGALLVVKRWPTRRHGTISPNARDVDVWDGKTWVDGYPPFCTLRCALSYARKAYRLTGGA